MTVHLEGMGLQGALLAHRLSMYGMPFTWHDTDAPHCAWKASTGAIYPAGAINHGPDQECYDVWKAWYEHGYFERSHLERSAGFVFCTKNPPHKGTYAHQEYAGDNLRIGAPSYHLNAQAFVEAMRNQHYLKRHKGPNTNVSTYIITHGWGQRLAFAYWGWTRKVRITATFDRVNGERAAFYFRPNRFSMAYAYPIPGSNYYYAGSSILKQRLGKFHDLDPVPKYERWKRIFEEQGAGHVKVAEEGDYLTGWRPAAAETDTAWVRVRSGLITLRPLWNSGIRHWPKQWAGVANRLGLIL